MMAKAVMDLPQPDSPTSAMVSPLRTVKLTLSTTLTSPWRGNLMHRFLTSSSTGDSSGGAWRSSRSPRSEEHTSELQSRGHLVCRLLLEKKRKKQTHKPLTHT